MARPRITVTGATLKTWCRVLEKSAHDSAMKSG
jgi:hypothetical protein